MKVKKLENGYYYKLELKKISATILIVEDCDEFELLKIIADPEKYFNLNVPLKKNIFPKIELFNFHKPKKLISLAKMKAHYKRILKADSYYFSLQAERALDQVFNIKPTTSMLSARGWTKDHYNYNKAEKWERKPAKRKIPARNVVKAKKR